MSGSDLVGLSYRPLFDFFADQPGAFRRARGDFVSTEEGTGIVHMAPGFGEDDQRLCEQAGIASSARSIRRPALPRKSPHTRACRSLKPTAPSSAT